MNARLASRRGDLGHARHRGDGDFEVSAAPRRPRRRKRVTRGPWGEYRRPADGDRNPRRPGRKYGRGRAGRTTWRHEGAARIDRAADRTMNSEQGIKVWDRRAPAAIRRRWRRIVIALVSASIA